jgi:hypothetical protein
VSASGVIDYATLEFAGGVIGIGPEGHHGTISLCREAPSSPCPMVICCGPTPS